MTESFLRFAQRLAFAALLLAAVAPARAVTPDDLLPVDQAFALTARPVDGGIELHWKVAPGYYLYRHRISAQADAGFSAGALRLPHGRAHHDEFFGDVETFHQDLTGTLPGTAVASRTVLTVRYQGCADAGICYPPQVRKLAIDLPVVSAPAASPTSNAGVFGRAGLVPGVGMDALPLPAEQAFAFEAIAGDGNTLLLRFTPARGYYLYRDRTTFRLDAASRAAGFALGTPAWPKPRRHRDENFGDMAVYFDQVDVPLPVQRRAPGARRIEISARFQGCQSDGICYPPMTRTVAVDLPPGRVGALAAVAAAPTGPTNAKSETDPAPSSEADAGGRPSAASGAIAPVDSGPAVAGAQAAPPTPTRAAGAVPAAVAVAPAAAGVLSALMLALLGGLVLNLMPCVLPVLSLKALSLAESGTPDAARRHAFGYTSGVVLSFLVLGGAALVLRHTGRALGWGFQLQQPLVVAILALVMFALALSLSGVWHVGGRWIGAGHTLTQRHGFAGDFFTGVLAVVVATPCTAPFMGAALAWAFLAPAPLALAVFATLGLGLALPFILIGLLPGLARLLPRPGMWMETLKQALAFPLYLTTAWLLWVLGRQRGPDAIAWALVAVVAVAFAAWGWTRSRNRHPAWGVVALLLALAGGGSALAVVHQLPRAESHVADVSSTHETFSQPRLDALQAAGRVVFVNITADWCVSCKANEKAVLGRPAFAAALRSADAVYMTGDWTDVNPELTAFLQAHGAVGVPLYVVYGRRGSARVLPAILTRGIVEDALREAAR